MTAPRLRLIKEGSESGKLDDQLPPAASAIVAASFKRVLSTPAAWPWRQRQMAELDARHGSPLPADQVSLQLIRLEPWRMGRSARFAIVYTRAAAGRAGLRRSQGALGDLLTLILPSSQPGLGRMNDPAWLVGLAYLAGAALFAFALATAWQRRTDTADDVARLQRRITLSERRAADTAAAKREAGELLALGLKDHSGSHVLADMAWVAQHLKPNAPVRAFHWREGVAAVEVTGTDTPFVPSDRHVQRASRPLRNGAWLWGVEPQASHPDLGR